MVCDRCVMVVEQVFTRMSIYPKKIVLGMVELTEEALPQDQLVQIDKALLDVGFERLDDRKARLVESIKNNVRHIIYQSPESLRKKNWSDLLTVEIPYEYTYMSSLFSSVEGVTLEHYIIKQKIERVKELLSYDQLSLSEIADLLGYSSTAHLSAQFKKITGLTPSALKGSRGSAMPRKPIDAI